MKNILLLLVAFNINGCASLYKNEDSFSQKIIGSWFLMDHGYKDSYTISLIAFTKDGRKCVVGTDYNLDHQGITDTTYWDNTWRIEDGYLITTVTQDSGRHLSPGYVIRDKILLLHNQQMNVLMETDSDYVPSLEKHVKLEGEDPARICEIVERHFGA